MSDHNYQSVVPWKQFFPNILTASSEIKNFYKKWKSSLLEGNPIDIEDNPSYLFAYLYESINEFLVTENINKLEIDFRHIKLNYPYGTINTYANDWLEDAYVYIKDYKKAYDIARNKDNKRIEDILFYSSKIDDVIILDGKVFIEIFGDNVLTSFGRNHVSEISRLLDLFLSDFQLENNSNFFEYFIKPIRQGDVSEDEINDFKRFYLKESDFLKYKEIDTRQIQSGYKKGYLNNCKKRLFQGVISQRSTTINNATGISLKLSYQSHSMIELETDIIELGHVLKNAMFNEGRRIMRETENTFREESGLPKIGEGWISETELYQKLKKSFSQYKVIHHGRPSWLGRQHLDIYFPDLNIGVEYQGLQHLVPVSYFGGESSYKIQQDLDIRKKVKCLKNKCRLIYVYEGYNFDNLKNEIDKYILECRTP